MNFFIKNFCFVFSFFYINALYAEQMRPLLPNIDRICKEPQAWVLELAKKHDESFQANPILVDGVCPSFENPLIKDFVKIVCECLAPVAASKFSEKIEFRTIEIADLHDRVGPDVANCASSLVSIFERMIGTEAIELRFGEEPSISSYTSNNEVSISQSEYADDGRLLGSYSTTRTVSPLVYVHPLNSRIDTSYKTQKIIHLVKKGFEDALYGDRAFIYTTNQPYSGSQILPSDFLITNLLNLQAYRDPKQIDVAWFYFTDRTNHWLVGQLRALIQYVLHPDYNGNDDYLSYLVEWYGHSIFKYQRNLNLVLEDISRGSKDRWRTLKIAKQLFIAVQNDHIDLLFDSKTQGLFLNFDVEEKLASFFNTMSGSEIETNLEKLISSLENVDQLDRLRKVLDLCKESLSEDSYQKLRNLLTETRAYHGLFAIVRCDESFEGCATLKYDLKKYYLNSEPEVKDVLNVAINAFLYQGSSCSPIFKFDSASIKGGKAGYLNSARGSLGCEVVIQAYPRISKSFWGAFVHEMAHKAFLVVYKNQAKPYLNNDNESFEAFQKVMQPIEQYLNPDLSTSDGNAWQKVLFTRQMLATIINPYNLIALLMYYQVIADIPVGYFLEAESFVDGVFLNMMGVIKYYPKDSWDEENVVRYYQNLVLHGRDKTDSFFVGMREFHRDYFISQARKSGFLKK